MAKIFKRITYMVLNAEGAAASQGPNLNLEKVDTAVQQAFSLWSSVAPIEFYKVTQERYADIIVRFVDLGHHTAVLANAGIEVNIGNELFVDQWEELHHHDVGFTIYDLVGLLAKEIGLRLHLGYNDTDPNSIMKSSFSGGLIRMLSAGDISTVQRLQGNLPRPKNSNFNLIAGSSTDPLQPGVHIIREDGIVQLDGIFGTSAAIYFSQPGTRGSFLNSIDLTFTTISSNVIVHTVEIFDGSTRLQKYYTCIRNEDFNNPTREWNLKLGLLQRRKIQDHLRIKIHTQFQQYNSDNRWVSGVVIFNSISSESLLIDSLVHPPIAV